MTPRACSIPSPDRHRCRPFLLPPLSPKWSHTCGWSAFTSFFLPFFILAALDRELQPTATRTHTPPRFPSHRLLELKEVGTLVLPPGTACVWTDFPGAFLFEGGFDNVTSGDGFYGHISM